MFDLSKPPAFPRKALICAISHGAAWLTDVVDLLMDNPAALPSPFPAAACGPELALLAAVRGDREPWPAEPERGSALVRTATWVPAFASEVTAGSLLALDGSRGRRAMRVTRLQRSERAHGFGMPLEVVTFLLVDAESGEPGALTVELLEPLTVAFEVPDTAESLAGGVL